MTKKKRLILKHKKKLTKSTWSLEWYFLKWLNEHVKAYKKEASKVVDLTYHKFDYNGVTYTQEQLIDRLIELSDGLILGHRYFSFENDFSNKSIINETNELLDIWKLVFFAMWW